MSTSTLVIANAHDWQTLVRVQQEQMRTGQYQRFARLEALCFEVNANSNPKMIELGKQETPDGRKAWPGKNLDWLGTGPELAFAAGGAGFILPSRPMPLPPEVPDPTFQWDPLNPKKTPDKIPQLLSDRAVVVKDTPFLCIQSVSSIQWILDVGKTRREIHQVVADGAGLHMAFIYDRKAMTGHLIGGRVL